MTIQQFIEKALEGGGYPKLDIISVDLFGFLYQVGREEFRFELSQILLDPLAFKAVGKVEGWPKDQFEYQIREGWNGKMHRMIDALAEGKTIEQYLETL